jgi:hypothetical protein
VGRRENWDHMRKKKKEMRREREAERAPEPQEEILKP